MSYFSEIKNPSSMNMVAMGTLHQQISRLMLCNNTKTALNTLWGSNTHRSTFRGRWTKALSADLWSHAVRYAPQHEGPKAVWAGQCGGDLVPCQVSYSVIVGELQMGLPAKSLLRVFSLRSSLTTQPFSCLNTVWNTQKNSLSNSNVKDDSTRWDMIFKRTWH